MAHEPIEVWCIPLDENGKEGRPFLRELILPKNADNKSTSGKRINVVIKEVKEAT